MLSDELYQGSSGLLLGVSGQAIVGTTPIVTIITGPMLVSLSFTLWSTGTVNGAWKLEASNDYLDVASALGPNAGHFVDITAAFRTPDATTGTAISQPAGSPATSYVEYLGNTAAGFGGRSLKITFTPASGAGRVGIAANNTRT